MADEAHEELGDDERVFEVVDLFDEVGGELALAVLEVAAAGLVPDVVFVEAEIGALWTFAEALDVTGGGVDGFDLLVDAEAGGEEVGGVVLWVADVAVEADVIGEAADVLEDGAIPFEVGVHARE